MQGHRARKPTVLKIYLSARLCLSETPNWLRSYDLVLMCKMLNPSFNWFKMLFATVLSVLRGRASLQLENVALRHQIGVLQRSAKRRPQLSTADRLLWVWLSRLWKEWRSALVIVKPETVIAWHRKAFRMFWTWKVRRGRTGRPAVTREVRDLIRLMSKENPSWGAPRTHGGLLKLGINIGETSVNKYLVRNRKPPSQTRRTFLGREPDYHSTYKISSFQPTSATWDESSARDAEIPITQGVFARPRRRSYEMAQRTRGRRVYLLRCHAFLHPSFE
jgi:hypothetical protein